LPGRRTHHKKNAHATHKKQRTPPKQKKHNAKSAAETNNKSAHPVADALEVVQG
jgi:hypothetical protein